MAVDRVIGIPHPWQQTALLCAILANQNRDPKTPPFKVEDFMPTRRQQKSTKEMAIRFNMFAEAHNEAIKQAGWRPK